MDAVGVYRAAVRICRRCSVLVLNTPRTLAFLVSIYLRSTAWFRYSFHMNSGQNPYVLRLLCCLVLGSPVTAKAHPVTFEDGFAFSQIIQPHAVLLESAYSVSPKLALGATFLRQEMDDGRVIGGVVNTNMLLFRRNGAGSQANLYGILGVGLKEEDQQNLMGMGALQADFETARFYTALMGRLFGDRQNRYWQTTYRVGFAPYEAEFSELQSWLVGQVMYAPHLNPDPNISGLLRFFYRTVLWEIGGDLRGRPWLQLMVHY